MSILSPDYPSRDAVQLNGAPYVLYPAADVSQTPLARIKRKVNKVTLFLALLAWTVIGGVTWMLSKKDSFGSASIMLTFLAAVVVYIALFLSVTHPTKLRLAFSAVVLVPFVGLLPLPVKPMLMLICLGAWVIGAIKLTQSGDELGSIPLASEQDCATPIWGKAGGNVAPGRVPFGEDGAGGKEIVGTTLDQLTVQYPWVRVFHDVKFAPNMVAPADIDLVLIGRHVYLIDAKLWQRDRTYSQRARELHDADAQLGMMECDGLPFPNGKSEMVSAWIAWKDYLNTLQYPGKVTYGRRKVESRVVLANPGRVDNGAHTGPALKLNTLDDLMGELSRLAQAEAPVVDRLFVAGCLAQIQR